MSTPLLSVSGLSKSFGMVEVLSDIDLDVMPGEVHAIIGENGAGKSTLMKILAGNQPPSRGEIRIEGEPVRLSGPVEAEARGIVLVHQEILLAPDLTVAQNIYLGREIGRMTLDDRSMNEGARRAIHDLGADIDPKITVARLSIAQRQLVQIARVLLVPHRLVIFDEPTASLTPIETDALIKLIKAIRARGVAVLYISHRLPEVKELADRVTVLRDGRKVASLPAGELEPADMARLMVGRDVSKLYPDRLQPASRETVLEVEDFDVLGYASKIGFSLGKGEILGFAGLVGAGRTELMEGLVGLRPSRGGTIRLFGNAVHFSDVHQSLKAGIAYLTEDRKGRGLLLQKDLKTNLTLASLRHFTKALQIDRKRERAALDKAISAFDIRTRNPDLLAGQLSGGNQQKLLIAKMMMLDPSIVIIDEPTRGIDIGTKEQIYRFIAELASSGKSVIVISSEMPELIGICDRILVMRAGRIAGSVSGEDMREEKIVVLATGVTSGEAA